jgi:ATP-binding cassette subfamily B protein
MYNIKYGRRGMQATDEEAIAAAEGAQISSFVNELPEKWETKVGERGLKLSGGEKQRVAIARCLLKNPPIVLLDEATSALDTETERSVQAALANLGKDRTTVVIAHRLSTVRHAECIVVMDRGVVLEAGTHEELLRNESSLGTYRGMWSAQLEGQFGVDVDAAGKEGKEGKEGAAAAGGGDGATAAGKAAAKKEK